MEIHTIDGQEEHTQLVGDVFEDPVAYLALLGIEAEVVELPGATLFLAA